MIGSRLSLLGIGAYPGVKCNVSMKIISNSQPSIEYFRHCDIKYLLFETGTLCLHFEPFDPTKPEDEFSLPTTSQSNQEVACWLAPLWGQSESEVLETVWYNFEEFYGRVWVPVSLCLCVYGSGHECEAVLLPGFAIIW